MAHPKTALVLGATGGVGGAIAAALLRHGWHPRGLARDVTAAQKLRFTSIEWQQGDAMQREDVFRAADNTSAIVHAVNPPGYRDWHKLVLPMIDNTIAAAKANGGARVVLPGTIYNYDAALTPVIHEGSPQAPRSQKGKIRVALKRRLIDAAPAVPSLILRAGDFFGPGSRASWFVQAMIAPGKPLSRVIDVVRGPGHSWAYLPDLAKTFARLLDDDVALRTVEILQFEGHCDADGSLLSTALDRIAGQRLPHRNFPWWLMRALAPFGGFPREAAELRSHWSTPVRLDNSRLTDLIGPEPRTDLDTALHRTLGSMGSMPTGELRSVQA